MLIYNKYLSVSPLTTHIPINKVDREIKKNIIFNKIRKIDNFYKKILKTRAKIAVTGLNPHCESFEKRNKEKNEIVPAIKLLKKKKIDVSGPFPADTIFLKDNLKKFDVIVGMYHDQVLSPFKALYGFDAVNITFGLPYIRMSPDHGIAEDKIRLNVSKPQSLNRCIEIITRLIK